MITYAAKALDSFKNIPYINEAMSNPFGLNFNVYDGKIFIPLGSALNCLGYNDFLERIIGVTRVALGLITLTTSSDTRRKQLAGLHIFRGVLEMVGSYEKTLLLLDGIATIYNISGKIFRYLKETIPFEKMLECLKGKLPEFCNKAKDTNTALQILITNPVDEELENFLGLQNKLI